MPISSILRDKLTRLCVSETEVTRQALRLIANDKTGQYAKNVQMRARLELHKMPKYTRPNAVHNRCVESGKTRVSRRFCDQRTVVLFDFLLWALDNLIDMEFPSLTSPLLFPGSCDGFQSE